MTDHAAASLARSDELWAEARATLADRGLVARCAWCERYRLGGAWVGENEIGGPLDPIKDTTHTICSLCDHRLRANGLSAPHSPA
jgi:hypothetical protein